MTVTKEMKRTVLLIVLSLSVITSFSHDLFICGNYYESIPSGPTTIGQNPEFKFIKDVDLYIYNGNTLKYVYMQKEKLYQDSRGNLFVTYLNRMERVMDTTYLVRPYFRYCFFGVMGTMYYFN